MKDKIVAWFLNLGERLLGFTKTIAARAYKEFGDDAIDIVAQVALLYAGKLPGSEKKLVAMQMLRNQIPKLVDVADWLVETVVQMAYAEYMSKKEEQTDTDGDGVPDYRDACKHLGKQLSGCVDENGCPDMDCDGKPGEQVK